MQKYNFTHFQNIHRIILRTSSIFSHELPNLFFFLTFPNTFFYILSKQLSFQIIVEINYFSISRRVGSITFEIRIYRKFS